MSADLNTHLTLEGSPEDLFLLLKVLKKFEVENSEQYGKNHDCAYIKLVNIKNGSHEEKLKSLDDDGIRSFISGNPGEIDVKASGPYGVFEKLGDVDLFKEMACAAPSASFDGFSSGFITGADVSLRGILKDGLLYLAEFYMPDEVRPEAYAQAIKQWLPHSEFCSLFEVDKDSFDDDQYWDLIIEAAYDGFPDIDYEEFIEYCSSNGAESEISEEKYRAAIEKVKKKGFVDYDTFVMDFDDSEYSTQTLFDPVTKEYRE